MGSARGDGAKTKPQLIEELRVLRDRLEAVESRIAGKTQATRGSQRAVRVLSACTRAVAESTQEQALLQRVCEVIVTAGGYRLAWVGYAEHDKAKTVRPVAHWGIDTSDVVALQTTWADDKQGRGPAGTAIRSGKTCVAHHILSDPAWAPWRDAAVQLGFGSSIALPLLDDDQCLGALSVYAREPEAFAADERALLAELATNLANGINALHAREDRKAAGLAASESEQRLAFHLQHTPIAAIEWNLKFEVTEWNAAAEKIFGYSRKQALGRHAAGLIVPESARPHVDRVWRELLQARGGYHSTNENITRDGRAIVCEWYNTPLLDRDGAVCGVASLTQDVTARQEAARALRERNDLLRAISDGQSLYITEAGSREVFETLLHHLLSLAESEYGFIGEVLAAADGMPYLKSHAITNIAWDDTTRSFYDTHAAGGMEFHNLKTLFGAVINSGRHVIANEPAKDPRRGGLPAGHPPLNAFLGLALRHGGRLIGVAGLANRPGGYDQELIAYLEPYLTTCANIMEAHGNVRERRRAEERAVSLARFPDENPDAVLRIGREGTIIYANRAGRSLMEFWQTDTGKALPDEWHQMIAETIASGTRNEISVEFDGRSYLLNLMPVPESGYVNIYGRDVTLQKRIEGQLLQAQKMESVGRLAGGVAHDFNNLLTVITAHCELASMQLLAEHPLFEDLEAIRDAAERASALTRQLLAFSRKQALKPEVLNLNRVLEGMGSLLARLLGEDVELRIETDPGLHHTKVDQGQIEQVIVNLAVNARDAMPDGGVLTIATRNHDLGLNEYRLGADARPGPCVELVVNDTGTGMSNEVKSKILEPFFTTKAVGRGTGLGLSTVYGIVSQSGGTLHVDSRPGAGSSFTILLPATRERAAAPHRPGEAQHLPRGDETILVVEDDETVRAVAVEMLVRQRYEVVEAGNGSDALALCRQREQPFDLILTDMVMPGLSGADLIQSLMKMWPGVKVLCMSGYTETVVTRPEVVANLPFVQKPFGPRTLTTKVREVLDA